MKRCLIIIQPVLVNIFLILIHSLLLFHLILIRECSFLALCRQITVNGDTCQKKPAEKIPSAFLLFFRFQVSRKFKITFFHLHSQKPCCKSTLFFFLVQAFLLNKPGKAAKNANGKKADQTPFPYVMLSCFSHSGRTPLGKYMLILPLSFPSRLKRCIDGITDDMADLLDLIIHILTGHIHVIKLSQAVPELLL